MGGGEGCLGPSIHFFLKVPFSYIYFRKAKFQTNWPSTLGKKFTKHAKIRQTNYQWKIHTHKHKKNSTCLIVRQNRQYVCLLYSIIRIKKRKYHHIHILLRTLHDLHHERIWKKCPGGEVVVVVVVFFFLFAEGKRRGGVQAFFNMYFL